MGLRTKPAGGAWFRLNVRASLSTSVANRVPPMVGKSSIVLTADGKATGASFTRAMFRVTVSVSLRLPSEVRMVRVSWPL
ncbi:hypothetical protein FQZ97_1066210 [compost metagenome]